MTTILIQIETGATIRQHCLACGSETHKHAVQAFCYMDGHNVPSGAICEACLQEQKVTTCLPVFGDVPTYAALMHERKAFDREEEQYYQTGIWPGLEERRRRAG